MEPTSIGRLLESAVAPAGDNWSFLVVGMDRASKLGELMDDLRGPMSESGDGKQIRSGFAYWGVGPVLAWRRACDDRTYPLMMRSIKSFSRRWQKTRLGLGQEPYHYVSLGPGTGDKDSVILADLQGRDSTSCYLPVDMSAEMLRQCVEDVSKTVGLSIADRTLPIQLDFSDPACVGQFRERIDVIFGNDAILFSLLGNTLANFDKDVALLRHLSEKLLRPDDRMLIEVATTSALNDPLADQAAREYRGAKAFIEWVTSPLQQYTDISVESHSVKFEGTVEAKRALRVVIYYQNRSRSTTMVILPDLSQVPFSRGDTIRLDITRKYLRTELTAMLSEAGLAELSTSHQVLGSHESAEGKVDDFGMALLLARPREATPTPNVEAWG